MRTPWLLVFLTLLVAAGPAFGAGVAAYQAADGSWGLVYPAWWEVAASRDGQAVAFVAPAVVVGQGRLRPSLVVSALPTPPGAKEGMVQQVEAQALAQGMPGAVLLGEEALAAADGRPVAVRYYSVPSGQAPPCTWWPASRCAAASTCCLGPRRRRCPTTGSRRRCSGRSSRRSGADSGAGGGRCGIEHLSGVTRHCGTQRETTQDLGAEWKDTAARRILPEPDISTPPQGTSGDADGRGS